MRPARTNQGEGKKSLAVWGRWLYLCLYLYVICNFNCISLICKLYYEACENQSRRRSKKGQAVWGWWLYLCFYLYFICICNCISLICKLYYEAWENQSRRRQKESRCVGVVVLGVEQRVSLVNHPL